MFDLVYGRALDTEQMPRLLILTPDFPPARGGVQVLAQRLAAGITGFKTRVLALNGPGGREFDSASGVSVRRVRASGGRRVGNALLNVAALREAGRFHPHATLSMHIVVSPAATLIHRASGAPGVQYFHAKEVSDKPRLSAFAAARADAVVAVSSYTAGLVAATGAAPARVEVIPPGVELGSAQPAPAATDGSPPVVLTVARLQDRYKGHDVLIEALARLRERGTALQWVVIGEGPLRRELEALARSRGLGEAARFLGALGDTQRDEWLDRCELVAMPSRLPEGGGAGEGFGIAYLEAAAHARPVVAGRVGGAPDAVLDGETGLLVDPTDAEAVAEAIARLVRDRELSRRLGAAAAERAREFAWPLIAARVEALLFELLAAAAHAARDGGRARGPSARTRA